MTAVWVATAIFAVTFLAITADWAHHTIVAWIGAVAYGGRRPVHGILLAGASARRPIRSACSLA